jgi:hypothetical protein
MPATERVLPPVRTRSPSGPPTSARSCCCHRTAPPSATASWPSMATPPMRGAEQFTEALLSELLRKSQATLAIAGFHGIEMEAIVRHESQPAAKVDAVQEQLAEVEDVLIAAAEASGHSLPENGTHQTVALPDLPQPWRCLGSSSPRRILADGRVARSPVPPTPGAWKRSG